MGGGIFREGGPIFGGREGGGIFMKQHQVKGTLAEKSAGSRFEGRGRNHAYMQPTQAHENDHIWQNSDMSLCSPCKHTISIIHMEWW